MQNKDEINDELFLNYDAWFSSRLNPILKERMGEIEEMITRIVRKIFANFESIQFYRDQGIMIINPGGLVITFAAGKGPLGSQPTMTLDESDILPIYRAWHHGLGNNMTRKDGDSLLARILVIAKSRYGKATKIVPHWLFGTLVITSEAKEYLYANGNLLEDAPI